MYPTVTLNPKTKMGSEMHIANSDDPAAHFWCYTAAVEAAKSFLRGLEEVEFECALEVARVLEDK